jgi:hypothetical protein
VILIDEFDDDCCPDEFLLFLIIALVLRNGKHKLFLDIAVDDCSVLRGTRYEGAVDPSSRSAKEKQRDDPMRLPRVFRKSGMLKVDDLFSSENDPCDQ